MAELRVLELYSGIGGMHFALKESGLNGQIKAAMEINTVANLVYEHNFSDSPPLNRNIESLTAEEIDGLQVNAILMSPPCQPFTRNGLRLHSEDRRTDSFAKLLAILPNVKGLEYVLMENVKGFEESDVRDSFVKTLKQCGFDYCEFLLSPNQFGIPNSRLRYYCLARRRPFAISGDLISTEPPFPQNSACYKIGQIVDDDVDDFLPEKYLKRALVLDICHEDSDRSCCFTGGYGRFLEGTGSVYTETSAIHTAEVFQALRGADTNSDEFKRGVRELKLRFFTPKEISRIMAFPESFSFPPIVTKRQAYRLIGNSVNIKVVSELLNFLVKG